MRFVLALLFTTVWGCSMNPVFAANWASTKPKLVVVIVLDQFRADYISRYASQMGKDGFLALTKGGAYYPYGEYDILQSMTGPGHATILTGAYPYQTGIPINDWYDQKEHAATNCVEDKSVEPPSSPRHLIGSTVGDELKNIDLPSKVVSLAIKDRAAILLGGHRPDLALWFESKTKHWVTSTYYRPDGQAPAWVSGLNVKVAACELDKPCSADLTAQAFVAALSGEKMGLGAGPDLLAVSFSGHDIAGHKFGPNSPQMREMTLAEDRALATMRAAVAKQVPGGLKNVLFVVTGDHGVAPVPEEVPGMGGGRIDERVLELRINQGLTQIYGKAPKGEWISFVLDFNFYIDEENARTAKVDLAKMEADIKKILVHENVFAQVLTLAEVEAHQYPPGIFERHASKTIFPGRSGHVIGMQRPFYINVGQHRANHMTGYTYDRTVPIVFSGFGIKPGLYAEKAEVVDIAPTLAFLLGTVPPALSEGRVLSEALAKAP